MQDANQGGSIDKAGVLDASINIVSGGIEIGGGEENPVLAIDGVFRVAFNSVRLGGYLSKHKEFGDAMPSNIGGMVGKMMDGNDFYKVGNGQKWGAFANDYALFIYTLGNGSQLETIFDPLAKATTLQKLSAGYSISANYYMFYGDLK